MDFLFISFSTLKFLLWSSINDKMSDIDRKIFEKKLGVLIDWLYVTVL